MPQDLIRLNAVEKWYGSNRVLGPVSLSISAGEVLGVFGSNGSGKSTLLSILAGVLAPDLGSVVRADCLKGAVGYVPQDIALYPTLSVWDNLRFWADVYGLPPRAARARIRWLLQLMQLEDKARARVENCSGGMKRRVNLACAMVITPRILLLDEPSVGTDAESAQIVLSTVERLSQGGTAVVMNTHVKQELERVSDRILLLQAGAPSFLESPPV